MNLKRELKGHAARHKSGVAGSSGKQMPRKQHKAPSMVDVTERQLRALSDLQGYCAEYEGPVSPTDIKTPLRTWDILDRKGLLTKEGRISRAGLDVLARKGVPLSDKWGPGCRY